MEKAKSFFKSEWQGLYMIHVDVETLMALCMKSLIKKALKSPTMKVRATKMTLIMLTLNINQLKKLWQNTS